MDQNDVLILAAGKGERMESVTKNIPKILINIDGKTILEHQMLVYKLFNIRELGIVTGYLSEKIKLKNVKKIYNSQWSTTNMLYSLYCAKDFLKKDGNLIIVYSDIIFSNKVFEKIFYSPFKNAIIQDNKWKNLWEKRFLNIFNDAETLKINKSKKSIIEIGKKTSYLKDIQGQYIGITKICYEMKLKILFILEKFLNNKKKFMNKKNINQCHMTDLLQYLIIEGNEINYEEINGEWFEFDTKNDLDVYKKEII